MAASVVAAPTKITQDVDTTVSEVLDVATATAGATATKAASADGSGHLLADVGGAANGVLEVTGPNAERLLLQLSPEVAGLLSNLGLPALGTPVGSIVASASSIGELVRNLGPDVQGLLTVVGQGGNYLLIQLTPGVAGLLSGLGLPGVGTAVGTILPTVGNNLKRDGILGDATPEVKGLLEVTGTDAQRLLIQLSPEAAALVSGLGLPNVGVPVGKVVEDASSVGELVNHIGAPVEQLLTVVRADGKALLIQLSPDVAGLVAGLGLTGVGASVGSVVKTVADNL
ncbi:hypothetical protein BDW62DRAFT_20397 [Aspergillus aurantiobrunneus]